MRVGYRARGSKSIVSINQCPVLSDVFADVFNVFDKVINQNKTLHSISHLQLCAADEQSFILI